METNPNHLAEPWLSEMKGRVQRLSVGVQSFNNDLLKQMDRYKKYGSGEEIFERIGQAAPYFDSVNVDMIFNFPSQTEIHPARRPGEDRCLRGASNHVQPAVRLKRHHPQDGEVAGQDGL